MYNDLYDEADFIDGYGIIELMDKYDEDYDLALQRAKRINAQRRLASERKFASEVDTLGHNETPALDNDYL